MKVLFIGGTGNISTSCSKLAVENGIDLYLLNRNSKKVDIKGVNIIKSDIRNIEQTKKVLDSYNFDVVVDWIAFTPEHVSFDYELFKGKIKQYIFISSASAYQKPPSHPFIRESTPLKNPYWQYSRDKIACELFLMQMYQQNDFPITIVRPSHTYDTVLPIASPGWDNYAFIDRLEKGKKIFVHDNGTSLWTVTRSEDFAKGLVGLLGNLQAIGHAFHITSDEVLTWNQIYTCIAHTVNTEPNLVHIPSDFIAKIDKETGDGLIGDKSYSMVFDNSKIKQFVPGFKADIPFQIGIKKTIDWFMQDDTRKQVDPNVDALYDKIINEYEKRFM